MPFTLDAAQSLFARLVEHLPHAIRQPRRTGPSLDALEGWQGTDDDLRLAAPLFTAAWLFDVLPRALGTARPKLLNSEGDEVVFHTVTFPFAPDAAREAIARRLGEMPASHQAAPTFWNWLGAASPRALRSSDEKDLIWHVTMDDGTVVLGNVELTARAVSLTANSAARAGRGREMFATALGGLVGAPRSECQTVEQMQAAPRPAGDRPTADIPPEEWTALVHAALDAQYRALLDEPVPMLGNVSPRTAARSARGRRNVAAWLKHLENHARNLPDQNDPMATYDFTWLWRTLKVEQLRN